MVGISGAPRLLMTETTMPRNSRTGTSARPRVDRRSVCACAATAGSARRDDTWVLQHREDVFKRCHQMMTYLSCGLFPVVGDVTTGHPVRRSPVVTSPTTGNLSLIH